MTISTDTYYLSPKMCLLLMAMPMVRRFFVCLIRPVAPSSRVYSYAPYSSLVNIFFELKWYVRKYIRPPCGSFVLGTTSL